MKYFLTGCLMIFYWCLFSQSDQQAQRRIDSVYKIVELSDEPVQKIKALSEITKNALDFPVKEVFKAIDLMAAIAEDSIQTYLVYNQNNTLGQYFRYLGQDTTALRFYQRNNDIALRYHLLPENINIAILHSGLGNREKALDLLREMKKSSIQYGLNHHAFALYWYGVINYPSYPDTGIFYIDSAIHIWENLPVGNVSVIYYTNEREPIALTQAYSFLVRKSLNEGNLDEAEVYLNKTKYYANEEQCSYGRYLSVLAEYFDTKSELDSALYYSGQMLSFYKKPNCWGEMLIGDIRSAHYKMYVFHNKLGHADSALFHFKKYMQIDRQLDNQLQARAIDLKEHQSEIEKEKRIHQQQMNEEEKKRNISIGTGLFLLILAVGFYSRWRYVRKSKAIIESERDRSDNLLLNILPADIAAELKEKGKADARDFEMVSILFTDFKGFTEQSAKLSAADLVNEINHCFEAFDGIMEKYGIEKIKTIGDAYMAAGGLPVQTDDSVKNTVLAALEMQEFIVQRHQTKVQSGEAAFEMRVGIHTGPVVAGIVGVKKFQYDIWGDTVNTASRMESAGEVGKVNISAATYDLLKDDPGFVFESRGKIEAKGKGTLNMYFVSKA